MVRLDKKINVADSVPRWDTHGVKRDDGKVNIHTHGLEKYGLKNLEMICDDEEEGRWGANVITDIILAEFDEGKQYKCGQGHIIDDIETYDIIHVFDLTDTVDEYGDKVAMINYRYTPVIHPDTGKMYIFNEDREWVCVT